MAIAKKVLPAIAVLMVTVVCAQAQIHLSRIHSRDVKEALNVDTRVDTVLTSTVVGNGVARTVLTMVLTPGSFEGYVWAGQTKDRVWTEKDLDSIEITSRFNLPTDFVAKNMWLWVNGEKQTAYIQDKHLASQQYNQIVGVRKDPALLQFWGNGSYDLRIFPAKSNQSRKIAIEFHHTFDDDSLDLITASIPVQFDSSYVYSQVTTEERQRKVLGYMRATLSSRNGSCSFSMSGLGSGGFTAATRPLVVEKSNLFQVSPGTITANDPSDNDEFFWTGIDTNQSIVAGMATVLSESTVVLEPEPDTRIVVLDVRQGTWNWNDYYRKRAESGGRTWSDRTYYDDTIDVWKRAQKFAIMCLQNYVADNQKFNVVFAGKNARSVFGSPVAPTRANLKAAYASIGAATPDPEASTERALEEALNQAPQGVAILISDLYRPYDYYTYDPDYKARISPIGADFDSLLARLEQLLGGSDLTMFTIADEWGLNRIAANSGGYRLAGLRHTYYYAYHRTDGGTSDIPELPGLFTDSPYQRGITDVAVTVDGLEDVTWTTDGWGYYFGWRTMAEPMMMDGVAKRTNPAKSAIAMPYPYYSNSTRLRVAGKFPAHPHRSATSVVVTAEGKLGGLGFTKTMKGWIHPTDAMEGNVQWAFRNSEQLAVDDWQANADAIKAIGKDYHIVTRQTSLLALEPGMELWEDTASVQQNQGGERTTLDASQPTTFGSDGTTGGTADGVNLDDVSLQELIDGTAVLNHAAQLKGRTRAVARLTHSTIQLSLPAVNKTTTVHLALYDLRGALISHKTVRNHAGSNLVWDVAESGTGLSHGRYVLKVKVVGGGEHVLRIARVD